METPNKSTTIRDDIRIGAENVSSPDSENYSVDHQEFDRIAVWGINQTTNATVPIASLHWRGEIHDDSKNCHKQYSVTVIESVVIRKWGRIGGYHRKATELSKVDEFDSEESAIAFANSTIRMKTSKGYQTVEVSL